MLNYNIYKQLLESVVLNESLVGFKNNNVHETKIKTSGLDKKHIDYLTDDTEYPCVPAAKCIIITLDDDESFERVGSVLPGDMKFNNCHYILRKQRNVETKFTKTSGNKWLEESGKSFGDDFINKHSGADMFNNMKSAIKRKGGYDAGWDLCVISTAKHHR